MKKITVLGAGMVGSVIAIDLSANFDVTSVDLNLDNLEYLKKNHGISVLQADFRDKPAITSAISDSDIVVNASPGFLGFEVLRTIIEEGKDAVDIAFFPEDAFRLDDLAKSRNVTAIVDCGVAPGMSNMILGYYNKIMNVSSFECYVGGLPFERELPFQYKAPFSPVDVIEEYTRPAKLVENGLVVVKPALSEPELMNFDGIGTLEAFNSDGLRSLTKTLSIPFMKEKTLRYPGHIEFIKGLMDAGFFGSELIELSGNKIKPIDLTLNLLFDKWHLNDNDDEFTVMKIIIRGNFNGEEKTIIYDLFDRRDKVSGFSSMSRTTGFTCSAAVNMLADGLYTKKGISPPEFPGEVQNCLNYVLNYLNERGVIFRKT